MKAAILDDYLDCALDFADWDRLHDRVEITRFIDPIPAAELVDRLAPFDILCLMRDRTPLGSEVISALPRLKLLSYTGPSNLTLDGIAAARANITVCNTTSPAGRTEHFEFIWALLLATMRDIPGNDAGMRAGRWQTGFGRSLHGRTIGILGLGNFGAMVADMAGRFGMTVLAWSENLTAERAAAHGATAIPLDDLLARSDVISVHLRLSERTQGLLGHDQFAAMKSGAILINTSRGPIVDEAALIKALQSGRLARAGLDVFDVEPLPADHPLRAIPNVVLSPHMGFSTEELLRAYYRETLDNIEAWLDGNPVRVVDADIIAGRRPAGGRDQPT